MGMTSTVPMVPKTLSAQPKAKLPPVSGEDPKRATPQPVRLVATPLVVADTAWGSCPLLRLDDDLREDIWLHLGDPYVLMRMTGVCVNFYNCFYDNSSAFKNAAAVKTEEVTEQTIDAEADLSKALPALEAAARALDMLDRNAITEMSSFSAAPPMLERVGEAVLALLNPSTDAEINVSWNEFRKQVRKGDFMRRLLYFDKDNLSPRKLTQLQKHMRSINLDAMPRVSVAGNRLAHWLNGICVYGSVAEEVSAKREKLRVLNHELHMINHSLQRSKERS